MTLFRCVVVLFFIIASFRIQGQQLQTELVYSDGYNACGKSVLTINVKNTSAQPIYPIIAEYDLNPIMNPEFVWSDVPNSFISQSGNKILITFLSELAVGGVYAFNIRMSSDNSCNLVSCSNIISTTDTLKLSYNSKTETTINKKNLQSPCLTYDEKLFKNRLYSAFLGDTVTRRIVLLNTGSGKFDGYLRVEDEFGPFVELDTIYSENSSYTTISSSLINPSTYVFHAKFNNVAGKDSIVIIEKVIVKKCVIDEEGKSSIKINWSCNTSLCKETEPYPIVAQILKNVKKPEVVIRKVIIPETNCLNSKTKYVYIIKNQGVRPAANLNFTLMSSDYNTYTYVDRNSLVLKDTTDLKLKHSFQSTLVPGVPKPFSFEHSCTMPNSLNKWDFVYEGLMPQDSFMLEYEAFHCCPGADTTNLPLTFETWGLSVKYTDECEEEHFTAASASEASNQISINQFYEPIITDMNGFAQQVSTFEIFNYTFTDDFYRINTGSMAFKIILKLDTGLVYVSNTLQIASTYGHILYPNEVNLISGGDVDGYKEDMIEATFILPDTFRINEPYFGRFMRNSSVKFDLKAECYAKTPTSRWTQEFYMIPDLSCDQTCEILLNTVTTDISVHCPGCRTPGWVADYYKVSRLTLGEKDSDNDRLPDNLSYVEPAINQLKLNRFIPGDTIETDYRAYVQEGENSPMGRTIAQLENNGAKSFEFKYSYLSSQISFGKLYQLNYAKVYIYDIDQSGIASGVDSIILPASAVKKIGNPVDSLPDAEFFYDLSLDTLFKYGIPTTYKYDAYDKIRIISNFTILEFFPHYRTTPPAPKDPWLLMENNGINLVYYNGLIYLTGVKNDSYDASKSAIPVNAQDPELLDGTLNYYCEAYGTASTMVGRLKEVSIGLPSAVQCKERASISIRMNPTGGIFKNPFPFEYRNFLEMDSLHVFVPNGYKLIDWTITNSIEKPDGNLEYDLCIVTDSLKNINEDGPFISLNLRELFAKKNQFNNAPCLDELVYGDELANVSIGFTYLPLCDLPENKRFYNSPKLFYKLRPNNIKYEYKLATQEVTKANAGLKLSPATNEMQLSQKNFCYPVNLEEIKGGNASYSFLKVQSVNQKIKVESLTNTETQETFLPDEFGVFQLDQLNAKSIHLFDLCLSNICGKVISKDTLLLIYGHDCFNYPDQSFSNICKVDTIQHYIIPANIDLQSFVQGPDEIEMCKPFVVNYNYQITGIGNIDNVILSMDDQHFEGVQVVAGQIEMDGVKANIMSRFNKEDLSFNLGTVLKSIHPDAIGAGDNFNISLTLNTDCNYSGMEMGTHVALVTSACDTLYDDTLRYIPTSFKGYPVPDNKSVISSFSELRNTGGAVDVELKIQNDALEVSKNKTRVTVIIPEGFSYSRMNLGQAPTIKADTLIWELNSGIQAGSHQDLKVRLNYSPIAYCDSVDIKILTGDLSIGCGGLPCVQRDTSYSYRLPVVCYPCPPVLSIGERCKGLPIFNTISWEYEQQIHCPEERKFQYNLYYSANETGNYQMIHSTVDTFYIHENLSAYEGCYYITITDSVGKVSDRSNIACNQTCNTQFECSDLFIANLVTVNQDGSNETFKITGAYLPLKVEIYNAWGSRVYKSEDYKNEWKGEGQVEGVYYYNVFVEGSDKACIGWVHLVK